MFVASGSEDGCCSSRLLISIHQGRGQGNGQCWLGPLFFYGRKQKLSQKLPFQLTFTYVLLARTVRTWNSSCKAGWEQVFLSGAKYTAALHKTRIPLAKRMEVVVSGGKVQCLP